MEANKFCCLYRLGGYNHPPPPPYPHCKDWGAPINPHIPTYCKDWGLQPPTPHIPTVRTGGSSQPPISPLQGGSNQPPPPHILGVVGGPSPYSGDMGGGGWFKPPSPYSGDMGVDWSTPVLTVHLRTGGLQSTPPHSMTWVMCAHTGPWWMVSLITTSTQIQEANKCACGIEIEDITTSKTLGTWLYM